MDSIINIKLLRKCSYRLQKVSVVFAVDYDNKNMKD